MNLDTVKVELIDWITNLNDQNSLKKLLMLKKQMSSKNMKTKKRVFGSGKHLVDFIAEDFDKPLEK